MQATQHIQRAEQLIQTHRTDEAIKELEKALAYEPENASALGLMASCWYNKGNYDCSRAFALFCCLLKFNAIR